MNAIPPTHDDSEPRSEESAPPISTERELELKGAFAIDRIARIAASIDLAPEQESDILEASHLTADEWEHLVEHADCLISADAGQDDLVRWDDAYIGRIEGDCGEVDRRRYAELVVSGEKGRTARWFELYGIPDSAQVPIERVWARRIASQPDVARLVRIEISSVRDGTDTEQG